MGVIENRIDILELERSGGGSGGTAASVTYDNTTSHMTATDVQAALDELNLDISATQENIAPVEDGETSDHAYAIGDYLMHNNALMRVTASISIGDTLTVGTNIAAESPVMKELTTGVASFTITDFENRDKIYSVPWARVSKYGKIGIVDIAVRVTGTLINELLLTANTLGDYAPLYDQELSVNIFNPDSGKIPFQLRPYVGMGGIYLHLNLSEYNVPADGISLHINGAYIIA